MQAAMSTRVWICRDCCCGSSTKHPEFNHQGQLAQLEAYGRASGGRLKIVRTRCLDVCERSNAFVIRTNRNTNGSSDEKPNTLWLGGVVSEPLTALLIRWLQSGGPLPKELQALQFTPSDDVRQRHDCEFGEGMPR